MIIRFVVIRSMAMAAIPGLVVTASPMAVAQELGPDIGAIMPVPESSIPPRRWTAPHVFWAKGYEAASLDDPCESTGLDRPSLHLAFGDQRALFLQTIDRETR